MSSALPADMSAGGRPIGITPARVAAIFLLFTAYFYALLFTLLPCLKANLALHPALYWFITGYFLFVPLLLFAVWSVRREGRRGLKDILAALNVKPLGRRDWTWAVLGLLLSFAMSGIVFGVSVVLTRILGWRPLVATPWFMEMRPFIGAEKLLLLVWLPMFFFNVAGEELLWRGYAQGRLREKHAWPLCSALWLLFHLPFGPDLMLVVAPVVIIIPYAFQRTRNVLVGVVIHALYNGPIFIAIALGLAH